MKHYKKQIQNYVSHISYTDLSPIPVRSAVKSYLTFRLDHNLKHAWLLGTGWQG